MQTATRGAPRRLRFGAFTADLAEFDVVRDGRKVRLQDQPFRVLAALLERPGRLVRREELRRRLWPDSAFVDFEHGLNTAIKKLRDALGDAPSEPRYIETIARHGYRFIAPVEVIAAAEGEPAGGEPVQEVACRLIWGDREIALAAGDNILGRRPGAAAWIEDDSVSRSHARIRVTGEAVILEDLQSKNGTFHRGARIEAPVALADGEEIRLGRVVMKVRVYHGPGPTVTSLRPEPGG